jgi:hypothetical protein
VQTALLQDRPVLRATPALPAQLEQQVILDQQVLPETPDQQVQPDHKVQIQQWKARPGLKVKLVPQDLQARLEPTALYRDQLARLEQQVTPDLPDLPALKVGRVFKER